MKNIKRISTKYRAKHHKGTFAYHPGNYPTPAIIPLSEGVLSDKSAKRDRKLINMSLLTTAINDVSPENKAEFTGTGMRINKNEITINDGLCRHLKGMFRYISLLQLLSMLMGENILNVSKIQIGQIKNYYMKNERTYDT